MFYATDAEGPLVLNDNAAELFGRLVGDGYGVLSKYVVYLWDVRGDPGYKAGDTLRVIVPFLKAHGASNDFLKKFSEDTIRFVPGAGETIRHVMESGVDSSVISTSYRPYMEAMCMITRFCPDSVYCTELDIDKYPMSPGEKKVLVEHGMTINAMQVPEWPRGARSLDDMDENHAETISRLNGMFDEVLAMDIGKCISDIDPVGGPGKTKAIRDHASRNRMSLDDAVYFGDSITDVDAFRNVRQEGGLAVSFNGNGPAIEEADIAIISGDTLPSSAVADAFMRGGKPAVIDMASNWKEVMERECLGDYGVHSGLSGLIYMSRKDGIPDVAVVEGNVNDVIARSERMRKGIRGLAGKLI